METVAAEAPTLLPLYGLCCEDLSFPATGEPVQRLKAYLRGRGLSFSAWRKLLLMAPGALHFVREFYYGSPREAVIDHLKVCDALGLHGHRPRWLLAKIYSVCGNSTHRRTSYLKRIEEGHFLENASHVVRLYLANALPVNPLDSGIVDDLMDWFARPNAAVLTRAQRQGLWPLLAGRASKWREACMVAESKNLSSWRPPFDRLNLEGLELVALADSGALSQESRALHNCINAPGYVKKCSSGSYCLASLRLNGKSIATAAYVKDDDNKWRLSIALGPCNQTLAGSIDSQLRQAGLHIGTSTTAN